MNFPTLPTRISLASTATLQPLERLGKALGVNVFIQREDLGAIGGGGNKLRKLECVLARALAQGCDTLVTFGALQSNHARLVAATAAKFGLQCELILNRKVQRTGAHYQQSGNVVLNRLLGTGLHVIGAQDDPLAYSRTLVEQLKAQGRTPYVIPFGGSDALGAIGFSSVVGELQQQAQTQQIAIDAVYLGSGSGGTQAGVLLGAELYGATFRTVGISVLHEKAALQGIVQGIYQSARDELKLPSDTTVQQAQVDDGYVGAGYGIPNASVREAMELMARTEGLFLDPVYTGKALSGLIGHCRCGQVAAGSNVVFLHTGGAPGIFAYADEYGDLI